MNHTQHRLKGVLFAIIGATLWGLGGTAFAFYLFIDSLKYLSPKETTLLGTIEPVIAVVTSALWLGVTSISPSNWNRINSYFNFNVVT